jgi:hypothetical protein
MFWIIFSLYLLVAFFIAGIVYNNRGTFETNSRGDGYVIATVLGLMWPALSLIPLIELSAYLVKKVEKRFVNRN